MNLADRVHETATDTGTGDLNLLGAEASKVPFSDVYAVGDGPISVTIAHRTAAEWEVVECVYSAADTLTRGEVIASSNSNNAVSFSAGTKDVFVTANRRDMRPLGRVWAISRGYAGP